MWWMIAKKQACQGGGSHMLTRHARSTASVTVFLRRQEGNTAVRGQQEQLLVNKMVNEGESVRVTQRD